MEFLAKTAQIEQDRKANQTRRARFGRLLRKLKEVPEDLDYTLDLICDELRYLEADGETLKDPTVWIDYMQSYLSTEYPARVRLAAQRLQNRLRELPAPPQLPESARAAPSPDPPPNPRPATSPLLHW